MNVDAETTIATRGVEPSDLFAMKMVNDPQVSPDGSTVAFTVTEMDKKANTYRAAIWTMALPDGEPRRLTSGRHRDGQPRWSPDGNTIAFTSDRDPDEAGKGQLWLIPTSGGEPTRLTRLDAPVEDFAWSPDGASLAAVSKVQEIKPDPDSDVKIIRTIRYRFDGQGFLEDKYSQIFVVNAADGNARQITSGPFEHRTPAWSPTGHEIAFSGNLNDGWEISPVRDIYAIRPAGKTVRRVTDGTGEWGQPSWSPDGTQIACFGTRRLESDSPRTEVFLVPAAGGSPHSLTESLDRSMSDGAIADTISYPGRAPLWSADGESLAVVCGDEGTVQLADVNVPDGGATLLTSGRHRIGGITRIPNGGFVFGMNTATTPGELFAADADGKNIRQLTHVNDDWLASVEISEPEPFRVASEDGTQIHGWIMKPVGFEPGKKYPMVLEIHGGPFGMYGETMMHEFQVLASHGYAVLFTNPRGSTGYGDAFAGDLYRAWGKNDFPDLMAAVDWAIAQGYIDENRLGVTGGSYGGFMTNWVISHTKRFSAAVTGRCVSNMYSMFGTDDIFAASAYQTIGALPWEEPEIYWELSPITYVDQIETPLLIEHQEEDYRCPVEQAEQMYISLKRQGKTVEFVRFPGESHGMSRTGKPMHRIERLNYILDWFDRFI
jgi:dipeptidyl aminopeptidase/acylaminoacyl peptidase